MPYTNPSSISNSSNAYFTNQTSKIYKKNYNILNNADSYSNYLVSEFKKVYTTSNPQIDYNNFSAVLQNQRDSARNSQLYYC